MSVTKLFLAAMLFMLHWVVKKHGTGIQIFMDWDDGCAGIDGGELLEDKLQMFSSKTFASFILNTVYSLQKVLPLETLERVTIKQ